MLDHVSNRRPDLEVTMATTLTPAQLATDVDRALAEVINFDMLHCGWVQVSDDAQRFAARLYGAKSDTLSVVVEDGQITVREFVDFGVSTETVFRGAPSRIIPRVAALASQILDEAAAR